MTTCKDTDFLKSYRDSDSYGRFKLLMDNYSIFPKVIRKIEKKIQYKIKSEREYMKGQTVNELGVRVMTSNLSDPTSREAIVNVTIDEAFATGTIDKELLKGIKNAEVYETDIRIIRIMRMDYELLEEIIEDLEDKDSRIVKAHLLEGKMFKEIADQEGRSYEAVKKQMDKIRMEIREEMVECLVMNCEKEAVI